MNTNTLEKLKPFIYGKMLGDAMIEKTAKPTYNSKLKIKQKVEHKEYVKQCWLKMHNHACQMYLSGSRRTHKNITKTHYAWVFKSKAHPVWNDLRVQWYDENGNKKFPDDLEKHFNEELLAYWFMDDGYNGPKPSHYQKFIATQSFSSEQVDYLVYLLNKKFSLNAKKVKERADKNGTIRYIIRFSGKDNMIYFHDLIKEYVPECMYYKIRIQLCQ
jgi:hypothetical protein